MLCLFISSSSFLNISNEYIQQLAVDDFNICQSIHQEELKNLERCEVLCILWKQKLTYENNYLFLLFLDFEIQWTIKLACIYNSSITSWPWSYIHPWYHKPLSYLIAWTSLLQLSNHFLKLSRWVAQYRLDKLKFARQKLPYCYFSGAATLFSPELSDARISWAKNGVLTTVVDDFFDVGGSIDELENLVQLVKK